MSAETPVRHASTRRRQFLLLLGVSIMSALQPAASAEAQPACADLTTNAAAEIDAAQFTAAPQRAKGQIYLKAPPTQVFDMATAPEGMVRWIPGLAGATYDNRASRTPGRIGVGSLRSLKFAGSEDAERIVAMTPPRVFAYAITGGVPVRNHVAIMLIDAHKDGGSVFTWVQHFDIEWTSVGGIALPLRVQGFVDQGLAKLASLLGGRAWEGCRGQ